MFLDRIHEILPNHSLDGVLKSFQEPKDCGFRVNLLKSSPENLAHAFQQQGIKLNELSFANSCYWVSREQRILLVDGPYSQTGEIYIQNPSSMLVATIVDPQPEETILDLAAAPGGKSIHIAQEMHNRGRLSVVESVRERFFRLQRNLKNCGVEIAKSYLMDGRKVGRKTPNRFDRILLDAPCSGEARIHVDDPKSWQFWSTKKIKECSRKQKGLIKSAIEALKPGGLLVYCTCSFAPEENENVVNWILQKEEFNLEIEPHDFNFLSDKLQPATTSGLTHFQKREFDPSISDAIRILPDQLFDGFFICKIRKLSAHN